MATGGSGWWENWLQTAKEKSSSVLEFMKKDLDEFTATVSHETSSIVNSTAATLRDKLNIEDQESTASAVKRSFSGFLDTVSTAFTVPKEPNDDDEAFVIKNDEPVVLNRLELQLLLLQRDMKTYLVEPSGRPEDYDAWLADFDLESKQVELGEMMAANSHLRSVYGRLVPADLSHSLFWHRYFYRVHQLLEAEKRRQALKQRADCPPGDDLELAWDEDDEVSRHVLTPQETDRILDEYQRECEEQAQNGSASSSSSVGLAAADRDNAEKQADITLASSAALLNRLAGPASVAATPGPQLPPSSAPLTGQMTVGPSDDLRRSFTATTTTSASAVGDQPESLRDELSRLPQCETSDLLRSSDPLSTSASSGNCQLPTSGEIISSGDSQPSSKDESLNDDEWEKDFDIALTEDLNKILPTDSDLTKQDLTNLAAAAATASQEEDWEKWQ